MLRLTVEQRQKLLRKATCARMNASGPFLRMGFTDREHARRQLEHVRKRGFRRRECKAVELPARARAGFRERGGGGGARCGRGWRRCARHRRWLRWWRRVRWWRRLRATRGGPATRDRQPKHHPPAPHSTHPDKVHPRSEKFPKTPEKW